MDTAPDVQSAHDAIVATFKGSIFHARDCAVGIASPDNLGRRIHDHHQLPENDFCGSSQCSTPELAVETYRMFLADGCIDGGIDGQSGTVVYVYRMVPGITCP